MDTKTTSSPTISQFLIAQYDTTARQISTEERFFLAIFALICSVIVLFPQDRYLFYVGSLGVIAALSIAFSLRRAALAERLTRLEEGIINLDPKLLDYYTETMSFRYYSRRTTMVVEMSTRAALPVLAI